MKTGNEDRAYWISVLERIADPVLKNLSSRSLKASMPLQGKIDRSSSSYLEAIGRLFTGIAPWLESQDGENAEKELRCKYAELARACIDASTDPQSPDYMNFCEGSQPVVDAAFLAHAVLRAPSQLWEMLEPRVKTNLIIAFKKTRTILPYYSNWLLFSAMIEAALFCMGEEYDKMRVDYALRQFDQWYMGDGIYGDGPDFHHDYYNSFVIQPMLLDIVRVLGNENDIWKGMEKNIVARASRYAEVQERLISPEGTFPPIGRSLAYRFGAFHLLAQAALQHILPESVSPAQVRCALTSVIHRVIEMPETFDENGWLRIGFCGDQPDVGEPYISTGSLYLCTAVFLPLGLAQDDPFWSGRPEAWTAKKMWMGQNMKCDHAISL